MKKLLLLLFLLISIAVYAGNNKTNIEKEANAKDWINKQPLEFIENKGQFANSDGKMAENVLFKASYGNCEIYITDKGLTYVFKKIETDSLHKSDSRLSISKSKFDQRKEENNKLFYYRLDMNLEGAEISKSNVIKEYESQQGHYNYFYAHCPRAIYDVKGYGKITVKNIYKGIDWVIYTDPTSKQHPLKYDFIVHPGADYKAIKIKFLNAQNLSLSENDSKLKIETIAGNIEEGNLHSFLKDGKNEVQSSYKISADTTITFEIADYDASRTLIIDPLVWATYYGGSNHENFTSVCVDSKDNVYITGMTMSLNFPISQLNGAFWQPINNGSLNTGDIFILKFNSLGVRLWATYYGGSDDDFASSICIDSFDNIFIAGTSESLDLPLQQSGNAYFQSGNNGIQTTAFIIKFDNTGIRQWATYYGGELSESAYSICCDKQNNIIVAGYTFSKSFPVMQNPASFFQANNLGYCNAFILKFTNQGERIWATYYGGELWDGAASVVTDSNDNIYIVGRTSSISFPVQQFNNSYFQASNADINSSDIFIVKFNKQGVRQWATCYGAPIYTESPSSICIDSHNNIYIIGNSACTNFPTFQMLGAYFQNNSSVFTYEEVFILKFDENGNRLWATLYGGDSHEIGWSIKTDKCDNIYLCGFTSSSNFPLQQLNGEYFDSGSNFSGASFIVKFDKYGVR